MFIVSREIYERIKRRNCLEPEELAKIIPDDIYIYTPHNIARKARVGVERVYQLAKEIADNGMAIKIERSWKFSIEAVDYIGTKLEGTVGRPRKRGG